MWVKICGNTNLEDAKLAAELGADAVGFIFAASKRQVTAAQAAAITRELPQNIERIGVFDSHDADAIAFLAREARLSAIQLHGGFDAALLEELGRTLPAQKISIIQALHWSIGGAGKDADAQTEQSYATIALLEEQLAAIARLGVTDRVLIDSKVGSSASGGTGVTFDWAAARSLFASAPAGLRLIVAGGLKPENVAHAIAELAPWGVDVSSGVESTPGCKDKDSLSAFITNARTATV